MQSNQNHGKPTPSSGILPVEAERDSSNIFDRYLAWKIAPNLLASFRYAVEGIVYAFRTQRNFRIHSVIASVAILLGIFSNVSHVEMCVIILTSALVLVLELLNTALESVVDLTIGQSYHALAKITKDCAAGAVLISAISAVIVAAFILLPAILHKFFRY